jgi:hypothetical protein
MAKKTHDDIHTGFEHRLDNGTTRELWDLNIAELTGHNIETQGREEVNKLLGEGWVLLHLYTLKYPENDIWRERPMAILGRPEGGNK